MSQIILAFYWKYVTNLSFVVDSAQSDAALFHTVITVFVLLFLRFDVSIKVTNTRIIW